MRKASFVRPHGVTVAWVAAGVIGGILAGFLVMAVYLAVPMAKEQAPTLPAS